MRNDYAFADLPQGAIRELRALESRLYEELGEEITLIAYEKEPPGADSTACRADLKGE